MDFLKLAEDRYSCRKISAQPVPEEMIEKIIRAGMLAPTAVNRQPVHIFRLQSEEAKEKLAEAMGRKFGAETFLAVGYKAEDAWVREFDGMNFAAVDAAIVATHMMLEITDLGLASTWVGHFDAPALKKLCPELRDYELIALFPVGFAADDAEPSPRHAQRKPREEMLTVL